MPLAESWETLDIQAQSHLEWLWAEGESRGRVGDLLSALQWAQRKRRILTGSWELFRTWSLLELRVRAPPLPASVCGRNKTEPPPSPPASS